MVYRGKLGKGCRECRSKRTRCDLARPSCGQCHRTGRLCSGYQDVKALRVIDQTQTVASKQRTNPTIPAALINIQAAACCIFFAEYANGSTNYIKTDFDTVGSIFDKAKPHGMLSDVICSLGMLALAGKTKDQSLLRSATQSYSIALSKGSLALADERAAKSDEVLAAVWLLSLYESFSSCGHEDEVQSIHYDGASQLLYHRGIEQFNAPDGRMMFVLVLLSIAMNCLEHKRRAPERLVHLAKLGRQTHHPELLSALQICEHICELCNVLANLANDPASAIALETALQALQSLESKMEAWPQTLSERYFFQRYQSNITSELNSYDVYEMHLPARIWMYYRMARIRVNEEMMQCALLLHVLGMEVEAELQASLDAAKLTTTQLSEDICYGVPFFLSPGNYDNKNKRGMTMYGGNAVLGPLLKVIESQRLSPVMHQWANDQIGRVRSETGIGQPWLEGRIMEISTP